MQAFPHHYHVSVKSGPDGPVVAGGDDVPDLDIQPPAEFGGPGGEWSPETLLTAAVANCFVLSFRAIAQASRLDWTSLICEVEGVLDRPERVTQFTRFNLHATLQIPTDAKLSLAHRLLVKAEQICLVTASLNSEVVLTTDIEIV